jgi:basic amino acid/polyamine antiporter, APA family
MQNVLIGIKLVLLACIIAAPFLVSPLVAPTDAPAAVPALINPLSAFGTALIAVAFTYGGYQSTINFGGDASSDGKQVSRAIIIGVVSITALYLAATWAYVQVLGFETLGSSSAIASMVMERLTGPVGTSLVSVALTISVFGYVNVAMLSNPRVITAMAEDGVLPKRMAMSNSSARGVNAATLSIFTALSIICVVFGESFEKILNYTIFLDCIGMATAAGALFLLRDAKPLSLSSRALAIVFIASYVFIAGSIFREDPAAGLYGIGLLALMIGAYWTVRKIWRST